MLAGLGSNISVKLTSVRPFAASLAQQAGLRWRWYADSKENVRIKRRGYVDTVKQEGALPRLRNDSAPYTQVIPTYQKVLQAWKGFTVKTIVR